MALRKQWRDLDRSTVGSAPERYGVYELGDAEGTVLAVEWGVLRDELKEVLAYGDVPGRSPGSSQTESGQPEQVRWKVAEHREHAKELAAKHRE